MNEIISESRKRHTKNKRVYYVETKNCETACGTTLSSGKTMQKADNGLLILFSDTGTGI